MAIDAGRANSEGPTRSNRSESAKVVGESCPSFGSSRTRIPKRAHRCFVGDTWLHFPGRAPYSGRDRRSCARPGAGCVLLEDGQLEIKWLQRKSPR